MSENLFTVGLGYAIETEDGGNTIYEEFTTAGVPSSSSLTADELALSDNAPIGSKCTDTVSGLEYRKKTVGAGESTWIRNATLDDIALADTGDTWRDPARIKDDTAYTNVAAAETALNTGQLDGIAIVDKDRILFTNITGANKNVFIVTGTVGSGATLVEDTNAATHNDTLKIDAGTHADNEFHYSTVSTSWVNSGQNGSNEDGFQNAYTGKPTLGALNPQYTSQNVVANNDNLTVAVGKLDAQAQVATDAIAAQALLDTALQAEVDANQASLGALVGTDGAYVPSTTTNYLDGNANITEDLTDLDAQVKANADAIASNGGNNSALAVTAVTVVDSVLVDDVKYAHWMVHVTQPTGKVRTFEVTATHNGDATTDATAKDYNKYARLSIGGSILGLRVRVGLSGTGATQAMQLRVQATSAVDVHTTRMQVI